MPNLYFRVPVYISFNPKRKVSREKLIEWLMETTVLDVDLEGDDTDNQYAFQGASIEWDQMTPISRESFDHDGCVPPLHGQKVYLRLLDANENPIEEGEHDANEAADKARVFILLHGADPDRKGKGAKAGIIEFDPVR